MGIDTGLTAWQARLPNRQTHIDNIKTKKKNNVWSGRRESNPRH
jgi:hypothetical protein